MDVRYNIVNWDDRATRGWSYGQEIVDPRTGEIVKGMVVLGSVRATVTTDSLDNINVVFGRMERGEIEGRVVLDFEAASVAAKPELVLA